MVSLFDYWFSHPNVWFNPTESDDEYITSTYFKHVQIPDSVDNFRKGMEAILYYDQVTRHAQRILGNINCDEFNMKILDFAKKFYCKYKYSLIPVEFVFILLPLRHSKIYSNILYVIKETIYKIKSEPKELEYKRFLKATLDKYIIQCNDTKNIEQIYPEESIDEITDLENICELGLEVFRPRPIHNLIPKKFDEKFQLTDKKLETTDKHIISLSGGVDSMVMSYILTKKYGSDNVVAVHINYNNRKECQSEVNIIKIWCSFLKIKLYIRTIVELNRPECMDLELRDLYETFTRNIRYTTYINTSKLLGIDKCIVYLGHNQDDRFENILTNIVSESHYSNLNGMEFESIQVCNSDEIIFIRPMLNIVKSDIFSFANFCQIPHFIDSTPKWSQRGKIRDIVRPAIETWEPKAIKSFFGLSDTITELMTMLDSTAHTYVEKIKNDNKLDININSIPQKILFKSIFTKLNLQITQKSLESFYEKMGFIKQNFEKYKVNTSNFFQLNKYTKLKWIKNNNEDFTLFFNEYMQTQSN